MPEMLFAFLVGAIAAASGLSLWTALLLVGLFVLLKGTLEILLKNHWLLIPGNESPFALYLANRGESVGDRSQPWMTYLGMMIGFGLPIGLVGFLLGRLFW